MAPSARLAAFIMPAANTEAMNELLKELSFDRINHSDWARLSGAPLGSNPANTRDGGRVASLADTTTLGTIAINVAARTADTEVQIAPPGKASLPPMPSSTTRQPSGFGVCKEESCARKAA
jgi:hypothetical protein